MNLRVVLSIAIKACLALKVLTGSGLFALDSSTAVKSCVLAELGVTELRLDNGLRICLKPTNFEEDEVVIKMTASGGFAGLSASQRASFELAPSVALESGLGDYNADQLSVLLYEHSAEFSLTVQAFSRSIEATAGKEDVELLFKLINFVFTQPKFTNDAFKQVVAQAKLSAEKRSFDSGRIYENAYLATNTQNYSALSPLKLGDILLADFESSYKFYGEAFADPHEFVCVVVGDFDIDATIKSVQKYLASIPAKKAQIGVNYTCLSRFPPATTIRRVKSYKNCEGINRLAFPVKVAIDENSIHELAFVSQLIEARLRKIVSRSTGSTQGLDVVYEFPFFPLLDNPWITIQFRSEEKLATILSEKIILELESLQIQGPSTQELVQAKMQKQQNDEFWMRQNDFWVATLSNYYLVGWPLKDVLRNIKAEEWSDSSQARDRIKKFFDIKNFTMVSSFQAL